MVIILLYKVESRRGSELKDFLVCGDYGVGGCDKVLESWRAWKYSVAILKMCLG